MRYVCVYEGCVKTLDARSRLEARLKMFRHLTGKNGDDDSIVIHHVLTDELRAAMIDLDDRWNDETCLSEYEDIRDNVLQLLREALL